MSLTMLGSSCGVNSILQLHYQTISRNRTTTKTLVISAKSGGGGANKKANSSTSFKTGGKFGSKNRRTSSSTTLKEEKEEEEERNYNEPNGTMTFQTLDGRINKDFYGEVDARLKELPGLEKDFWEGSQWDTFGFIVQYLWAFGILFALVACGVAVATYNEGAADFKQTPAYKESIQSREFLEEPESSNSDVFESNPTEEAPSLE